MDAAVWSLLPLELVEKVLSFVPVPDLCRYQRVCREWNEIICNPAFATVHAQNDKRGGASFIAIDMQGLQEWCLLDLNARRWYKFPDDDNIIARRNHAGPLGLEVAAMDGGLVCRFSKTEPQMLSIFVHDLLGHTVKSLPLIRRHLKARFLPVAHMVVDSTSHHFMIFLLYHGFDLEDLYTLNNITSEERLKIMNDPLMRVYDSATGEWRSASNPPWIRELGFPEVFTMVMCQGLLYAITDEFDQWIAICYNPAEDAWKRIYFGLYKHEIRYPQLIATTSRLFVAVWRFSLKVPGGYEFDFEVSEINIPTMIPEILLKLPMPEVVELLEVKTRNFDFIESAKHTCRAPWFLGMTVTGVDNTAFFVQSWLSRKAKMYDLDTRSWDHGIPELPLRHQWSGNGPNHIAKQMNLLLPNSLQYHI